MACRSSFSTSPRPTPCCGITVSISASAITWVSTDRQACPRDDECRRVERMSDTDDVAVTGKRIRFTRLRWLVHVMRHPSAVLLVVQLVGLLLYPFIEHTRSARALFGAFGVLVLCLAIAMVQRTRRTG